MAADKGSDHQIPIQGDNSTASYKKKFSDRPAPRTAQNTRSVTIRQLLAASKKNKHQGRFMLDNTQLYSVRLCGRLIHIEQEDAHTNYKIDDGTGVLPGRIWTTNKTGNTDLSGASLGAYYEIITNMVQDNVGVLLQTLMARKIVDHNTITMHMLQAIHEHCTLDRWSKADNKRWQRAAHEAKHVAINSMGLELDKEAIISYLSNDNIRSKPAGATSYQILSAAHLEETHGRKALNAMLNEGSIYNTTDYDHFKMADDN